MHYFTHDSVGNSDHVPLCITCKIDCNDLIVIDEPTAHVPKLKWKFLELDRRLWLFKIFSELINCKHCTSTNDHERQIADFHDTLVLMRESMATSIYSVLD